MPQRAMAVPMTRVLPSGALDARIEELERSEGGERAALLAMIATGKGTPIASLMDDWLLEKAMRPRQTLDYRRAVTKFEAWLVTTAKRPSTVETVNRKVAADYKTQAFVRTGVHPKTANKDISALSGFWKWLEPRGLVTENVWQGQSLPKGRRTVKSRATATPVSRPKPTPWRHEEWGGLSSAVA